jgi:predicted glycosyltransferase
MPRAPPAIIYRFVKSKMKIILYCQNLVGIGHYLRSLEICRAFKGHDVILITGGPPIGIAPPNHVREVRLPVLTMDFGFKRLISTNKRHSLGDVKRARQKRMLELFEREAPVLFIVELFPFGRSAFNFELEPVFKGIRHGDFPGSHVICSLRDILVEKRDPIAYEERVIEMLNRYFDILLVHSDPSLITLHETFSRVNDIEIPLFYTGFITPKPPPNARQTIRKQLGLQKRDKIVVASSGGGKVGFRLLETVAHAFRLMESEGSIHLILFTGPLIKDEAFDRLQALSVDRMQVFRFTQDFVSYLAAADLSVSMAGYNTCMNILAAGVPAMVWPYARNREQGLRAKMLARLKAVDVIGEEDLQPVKLASLMDKALRRKSQSPIEIDLEGATKTVSMLRSWAQGLETS